LFISEDLRRFESEEMQEGTRVSSTLNYEESRRKPRWHVRSYICNLSYTCMWNYSNLAQALIPPM